MQTDYEDTVTFLAVVRENDDGDPADVEFAGEYAEDYDFNFPTTNDGGGLWVTYMGSGYPSHAIFDLTTMELRYTRSGLMTENEIRAKLDQLLE